MINAIKLANNIRNKLELLIKGGYETEITIIKKCGNVEQLGISNIGENIQTEKYKITVIFIIRGSDRNATGELQNNMELGNNPDTYLEFIRIFNFDNEINENKQTIYIKTGDRIRHKQDEYIVNEILPVTLGGELLFEQYNAKKVL